MYIDKQYIYIYIYIYLTPMRIEKETALLFIIPNILSVLS